MADREYLSLYAEQASGEAGFYVRNFPSPGERTPEQAVLEQLAAEGWRLETITPAHTRRRHDAESHLLYLERSVTAARTAPSQRVIRLLCDDGRVESIRGVPYTTVGQQVTSQHGLIVRFLGVTRLTRGRPDTSLLGKTSFAEDRRAAMTGLISVNGQGLDADGDAADEIYSQFLPENLDGTFSGDDHAPERLTIDRHGLMVGVPFGNAHLTARIPVRIARYEYLVFTGAEQLRKATEILVRYRFEIVPRYIHRHGIR